MLDMQQNEWEKINDIVSKISEIDDIKAMREKFLRELKLLIYFDLADFCLSDFRAGKAVSLIDPVVISRYSKNFEELFTFKYEKQFEQFDYTKWVFSNPDSIVFKESDIINNDARMKSAYYINYLKPMDLVNVAGMSLAHNGTQLGAVNLYRTEKRGDFTDKDLYILNQFLPHLTRKLMVHYRESVKNLEKYKKTASFLTLEYNLSKREIEILKLVCDGKNNKEISETLSIAVNTVKKHMGNILYKFQVENRFQLVNYLIKNDKELFEDNNL
ncbi:helix-turn-helix transcriptional regulator [Anoxybacterium hadale]|uniref:Helix-turn-helix transcriptional regulator n=1 Tax=Anoxybacterium hadale TaxID=3408580 RepID=A0ACD1AEY3_9FIRM|nr:helix-turn-helix transcriptional regulator [Clostridiales bacterium]